MPTSQINKLLNVLPQGFPDHPHRGQATVTYMLEGASRHEDSEGHKGTIEQGGVQYMVAGKGECHPAASIELLLTDSRW